MILEFLEIGLVHFAFCCLRVLNGSSFPPPLPKEEEEKLFLEMKEGKEGAREKLIEHNLRLVAHIIKKYDTEKEEQEDLISIGTIGLIKAIDSFNPSQGTRFATYAGKCVQNEILMYVRSQKKYAQETSLQEALEVDEDGNPLTVMDVMRVEDDVVDQIDLKYQTAVALRAVETHLDSREREVIQMRFGLGGFSPVTQREVARRMKISRSYVSRIEKSALEKLRSKITNSQNYI